MNFDKMRQEKVEEIEKILKRCLPAPRIDWRGCCSSREWSWR